MARLSTNFRFAFGMTASAVNIFVFAQPYPVNPVRWIVPVTAGGPIDLVTRAIAQPLSAVLGQPVIVDVRASASQIVGVVAVAQAAPDGYTILSHSNLAPHKFL